ncbi:hypothetical protein [Candidatus Nesciobacter abundans]|uniref:Uncharacterized protein n=1 Tax=Candidatus Nesciobacter abundans TaxID=2601668 RepID=A0A5C0UHV5_9PROT|nr:hypothetical protein [Candidatus Nesciobacter abundans]QEK38952.1 hypothetical protein FZC36_00675 [Candidatus Nesciobacter abundans]
MKKIFLLTQIIAMNVFAMSGGEEIGCMPSSPVQVPGQAVEPAAPSSATPVNDGEDLKLDSGQAGQISEPVVSSTGTQTELNLEPDHAEHLKKVFQGGLEGLGTQFFVQHKEEILGFIDSLKYKSKEEQESAKQSYQNMKEILKTNPYRAGHDSDSYDFYVEKATVLIKELFKVEGGDLTDASVGKLLDVKDYELMKAYIENAMNKSIGVEFFEGVDLNSDVFRVMEDSLKHERTKIIESIFSHFCEYVLGSEFGIGRVRSCAIAVQSRIQDLLQGSISNYEKKIESIKSKIANLEKEKTTLKTDKADLETKISSAKKKRDLNIINFFNPKLKAVKTKINNLTNKIEKLQKDLNGIPCLNMDKFHPRTFDNRDGTIAHYLKILRKNIRVEYLDKALVIEDNGDMSRGYFRIFSHLANMAKHGINPYEYALMSEASEIEKQGLEIDKKNTEMSDLESRYYRLVKRSRRKQEYKNRR